MAASAAGRDVSARIHSSGASAPKRSARTRTCCADSSADTRRQRFPAAAKPPSTWSSRVDLPMPGSPPSNVTEPETSPPPSTRSSSVNPVGQAMALAGSMSASGVAIAPGSRAAKVAPPDALPPEEWASLASSTSVFHSPQPGHRPTQRADTEPQSLQRWTVLDRAMPAPYGGGATETADLLRNSQRTAMTRRPNAPTAATTAKAIGRVFQLREEVASVIRSPSFGRHTAPLPAAVGAFDDVTDPGSRA